MTGCIENALSLARAQSASFLELRAATSLARLRLDQGRVSDPVACLRATYEDFPRDQDAPDLRDARALLATTP